MCVGSAAGGARTPTAADQDRSGTSPAPRRSPRRRCRQHRGATGKRPLAGPRHRHAGRRVIPSATLLAAEEQGPPTAGQSLYIAATTGARSPSGGFDQIAAKSLLIAPPRSPPSTPTSTRAGGVLSRRAAPRESTRSPPLLSPRRWRTSDCVPSGSGWLLTVDLPAPFGHGISWSYVPRRLLQDMRGARRWR